MSNYNISYEVASVFFMVISIACLVMMRRTRTDRYKKFLVLMISVLCGLIFDILGAVSIAVPEYFSPAITLIINTVYFFFAAFAGYVYLRYAEAFVGEQNKFDKVMIKVNMALMITYTVVLIINMKAGWIFYLGENNVYNFGPIHFLCYVPTFYFIVYVLIYALMHYKSLNLREMISLSGFIFITIGTIFQALVAPGTLLVFFFGTIGVMIILLFVETPDYAHLQETLVELDACKIEAEKAKRVKGEFLTSVSRDIKTPMSTVLGMDEMILRESRDEYITGYARDIESAGLTLMETINKILDYADIETGKLDIVNAPYKVSSLVKDVYKTCLFRADEKGLKLNCDVGNLVPEILVGDVVRIRQIMLNLIGNAIKYTSKGHVSLYVGSSALDGKSISLEIKVTDTGRGIKEEELGKVFGTFDRLGDTRSRAGDGVGLGLAIVSKLTDMMNGEVSAESKYGEGSVFTVKIPQRIAEQSDLIDEDVDNPTYGEKAHEGPLFKAPEAKVLIVDDNDINRVLEAMLLKETEVITNQVSGGKQMLEELTRNSYDVVLLDHIMPDMDGVEALRRARQIERVKNASTSFIAITANALSGAREEYLRQGFDDFVSKPVNGRRLEEAVMNLLDDNLISERNDM
ncbi:MAG: response regulator [Lachnospiraceae bacterium]|nr:response regulator [Lachnospiraceae bacterium]